MDAPPSAKKDHRWHLWQEKVCGIALDIRALDLFRPKLSWVVCSETLTFEEKHIIKNQFQGLRGLINIMECFEPI